MSIHSKKEKNMSKHDIFIGEFCRIMDLSMVEKIELHDSSKNKKEMTSFLDVWFV